MHWLSLCRQLKVQLLCHSGPAALYEARPVGPSPSASARAPFGTVPPEQQCTFRAPQPVFLLPLSSCASLGLLRRPCHGLGYSCPRPQPSHTPPRVVFVALRVQSPTAGVGDPPCCTKASTCFMAWRNVPLLARLTVAWRRCLAAFLGSPFASSVLAVSPRRRGMGLVRGVPRHLFSRPLGSRLLASPFPGGVVPASSH